MKILHFILEGLRLATSAVLSNKTRSALTVLGVAIGIFLITGILSLVDSMQYSVTKNLSALGNTTLFVHHWPWKDNSEDWFKYFNRPQVSYTDYRELELGLDRVQGVLFEASVGQQTVKYEGRSVSPINVQGATRDLMAIKEFELSEGRPISQAEFRRGSKVTVLGAEIAKGLFGNRNPLGKRIRVAGTRLTVVGVLEARGATFGRSDDYVLYIPYEALRQLYNVNRRGVDKIVTIKASTAEDVPYVEEATIGLVRRARGLRPTADNNFSINKQEMLMDQIDAVFSIMRVAGTIISGFSVLVALFSIGLIMYIIVYERRREIGIQKALGSTRSFILYQFLTEALLICLAGGVVGLLLVWGFFTGLQAYIDSGDSSFELVLTEGRLLFGVGISLTMGLIAGVAPASIAANVDPVVAIRSN